MSCRCNSSEEGGAPAISAIHPDIFQSHILNRLDGPTLASTGCATAQFYSLCSDDHLWRNICHSTWPSTADSRVGKVISTFSSGHRSLYSEAFPALRHHQSGKTNRPRVSDTTEFISAVDIHFGDNLIYSKVLVTETSSCWFRTSPFQVDLLGPKETVATPVKFDVEDDTCMSCAEEGLRVSWILIDPVKKRAFNVASLKPVETRRHWLTDDVQLRYATVVDGGGGELVQCGVVVTCGGEDGGELCVREVSMQVEDLEGKILTGMDSLVILNEAMAGQREKSDGKLEKDVYQMFWRMKVENGERKQKRERRLDMVCIVASLVITFLIWFIFLSR